MKDDPKTNVEFVQMIESLPWVYNHQNIEYSNKSKQEEAWKEIGLKFDGTVAECKERWKNLRACYSRELKAQLSGSNRIKKPYYLAEHLKFLIPFTRTRKQCANLPVSCSNYQLEGLEEQEDYAVDVLKNEPEPECDTMIDDFNATSYQNSSNSNFTEPDPQLWTLPANHLKPKSKKRRRSVHLEDAALEFFIKHNKVDTNQEDLDLCFFKSLLPDVKQMNADQKRRFKVGILNLSGTILNEQIPPLTNYRNINKNYQVIERCPNSASSSVQNNVFPRMISRQAFQSIPQEHFYPTTNNGEGEYENNESRPNSALSSTSSKEYKLRCSPPSIIQ